MAQYLSCDSSGVQCAAERIRGGKLVAFPTETVYGLGANALDSEAVASIFKVKGRPLTDPLIVHVRNKEQALPLVQLSHKGAKVFSVLAQSFWPGPLTIIVEASNQIPPLVTANTGFVGIRCPNHPNALDLLREAQVPIAAPSANRFGHVSPTSAEHVMSDLGQHANVSIIKALDTSKNCEIGIESTVIRIVPDLEQVWVFRRGATSENALARILVDEAEQIGATYELVVKQSTQKESKVNQQAPGQLLTHYAPDVETILVQADKIDGHSVVALDQALDLAHCVIIDFNGQLAGLKTKSLAYRDLAPSGDIMSAVYQLFDVLRWAELVPGVTRVLMADIEHIKHEHTAALRDRMFRAASGKLQRLHTSHI